MITKPINYMTLIQNQSHDLSTWLTNLILDIKLSKYIRIIIISMSWPHPGLSSITSILLHPDLFIITAHISNKFRDLAWALSKVLWRPTRKTTSRLTPVLDPVMIAWEEFSQLLQEKTTKRSHKWSDKEDNCPDTVWPNLFWCQYQYQLWSIILRDK